VLLVFVVLVVNEVCVLWVLPVSLERDQSCLLCTALLGFVVLVLNVVCVSSLLGVSLKRDQSVIWVLLEVVLRGSRMLVVLWCVSRVVVWLSVFGV